MNKEQDIHGELKSISSYVAALPRTLPYSVPDGYFESFKDAVDEHITAYWGKNMPYTIPHGYFDTLTVNIVTQATGNTEALAKKIPYTTPTGYFDTLPEQMLSKVNALDNDGHKTMIIPLQRRGIFRRLRWMAAAIVIMGIGIGSYLTLDNAQQGIGADKILASIPNSEIQDYVQGTYRVDVNRIVSNNTNINEMPLDNSDIITFLDETGWD